MQTTTQVQTRKYDYTETNAMWNAIGNFLRLWNEDNVYVYGKYSFLCELPETTKLYIIKRNNHILFENFWFYFEQIISVHCYQLIDMQGKVIANPLRIRGNDSDNTNPFEPRKALYMSIKVRNYTGPEVPDHFENEEYIKEYYFMRNAYGIFISGTGFDLPQNMHLITITHTKNMSNEEMTQLIESTYEEDDEDDESNEISLNHSNDNSNIPLM